LVGERRRSSQPGQRHSYVSRSFAIISVSVKAAFGILLITYFLVTAGGELYAVRSHAREAV
jgi:hypothetical protein